MIWLSENFPTILAGLAVAAIVILPIVLKRVRRKKAPVAPCSGGCCGCPYAGQCRRG